MRSLVTGGAGFIGSHVSDALLAQGHGVLVVDDLSHGKREQVSPAAQFAQADVTSTAGEGVLRDYAPHAVFHLAAQMDVRRSVADPVFDAHVNVEGSLRMARAAAKAGASLFVLASTGGAVYGEQERFPADESHPLRPASPYGASKASAEIYVDYFGRAHGMRTVMLRLANVYGPRQDPHGEAGVVAIFAGKMLRGEPPAVFGDGAQTRDYVYVGDVVAAHLAALTRENAHGHYNVGTGRETDVNTLARLVAELTGYAGKIERAAAKAGEQRRSVLDAGRAARDLEWRPQIGLSEGLRRTVQWFKERVKT
ncbi:MAG: NAD-dependent epimerase/dehydratase family protein [Deltaproteobacteria bacterium]|nr:NAD-dependent epimerase/dehydratase family protein [Deltaproteobacteria bacterium]